MAFTIGEYQDIFLEEADEQLQELNQSLLELEKNPDQIHTETINSIFRTAHSLKSSAAFVGLNDLSDLAHHMENLLQGVRDETMKMTPEIIEVLFECFDLINSIINSVASGEEPTQDLSVTIRKIKNIADNSNAVEPAKESGLKEKKKENSKIQYTQNEIKTLTGGLKIEKPCYELYIEIDPDAQMKWIKIQLIMNSLDQFVEVIKSEPEVDNISDDWKDSSFKITFFTDQPVEKIKEVCVIDQINRVEIRKVSLSKKNNKTAMKFHDKEVLFQEKEEENPSEAEITSQSPENITVDKTSALYDEDHEEIAFGRRKEDKKAVSLKIVKVSVDKLDLLLNTVGELVIANSGFFSLFDDLKKTNTDKSIIGEFKNRMDQMSRIAKDLQSRIMQTRMVPIGQVLSRFNRPVRDLAKEFKKNIKFVIKGEDTELDKKVIDVIGEPLLHLLRNSIDHGVEKPEERRRLGKPEEAVVSINAYQGGNQIFVEVGDDGKGLDIEKIRKIALKKNLVGPEMLDNMSNDDICEFIFHPGFSTADIVTDISGRGVGMNVVKETVNELNGSVRIETEPGMGTNFILAFPLTLAIIPAIMVKVREEMYSIPLPDVIETIKIIQSDITTIEGREVINLRGEILSLLRLNEFIGINSSLTEEMKTPVVVVGYGNRKIGVIVDSLEGKQEIVIKSLEENYTNIDGLSGASILGDGSICLILDIASMINKVISDEEKMLRYRKSGDLDIKRIDERVVEIEKEVSEVEPEPVILFDEQEESGKIKSEPVKPKPTPVTDISSESLTIDEDTEFGIDISSEHEEKDITEDIIFNKEDVVEEPETIEKIPDQPEDITSDTKDDIIQSYKDEVNDSDKKMAESTTVISDQSAEEKNFVKDDDIEDKVKETLNGFRQELEDNIMSNVNVDSDDVIIKSLEIEKKDMEKIDVIANIGAANAAESLSRILDKGVSLSIPEVEIVPIKNIAKSIGDIDTVYLGVFMPVTGDINGAVLFSFTEESGFELIDLLYGMSTGKTKTLDQDGESALKELTNIIGSSMINALSEKINLSIRPDVPTVIHDYIQSTVDSVLLQNNITGDYAMSMNTYFFHQDDKVIGNLIILSETESLKRMINMLKNS
ncbi:MAG: chemotaxis protein CheW [Spirochaetes bacterium]|nr:chemotaxis protein CheW [Spirochaetota bacterium]